MRKFVAPLATAALAVLAGAAPCRAEMVYPWCANYGGHIGGTNCGFTSFEQCRVTVLGTGGYCERNPWYDTIPSQPVIRKPRRSVG
jgi:hypothetical protein